MESDMNLKILWFNREVADLALLGMRVIFHTHTYIHNIKINTHDESLQLRNYFLCGFLSKLCWYEWYPNE